MAVFFRNYYYYLSLTMSVTCAEYQENTKLSYLFQKGIEKKYRMEKSDRKRTHFICLV